MKLLATFAVAALASTASAAHAASGGPASGRWLVSGKVAGFAFTLNCRFEQSGQSLAGACVDGATSDPKIKGGRRHPLIRGRVEGDKVTWTYVSSFLFTHFNVDYAGVLSGGAMTGDVTAQDKTGAFSAHRQDN